MNPNEKEILYRLIREHEEVMGVSRTTMVALDSFRHALQKLKNSDNGTFKDSVLELNAAIKNTEPKIIPLTHLIEEFETELQIHFGNPFEQIRDHALKILSQKIARYEACIQGVVNHGMQIVEENDLIIVQSPSLTIRGALKQAHSELNKQFKVLILDQNFIRIKQLIKELSRAGIEFLVIPEYNLSHILETATKLLIGAVSITPDRKIITTVGTANAVGLCHLYRIPIYLLANSLKFAHQIVSQQHIYREEIQRSHDNLTYRHAAYSHDQVDLHLIDHVITEQGKIAI
jgi:translation initiation factor 2B subunit (eIF-2B alpha/beta/delta family)